MSRPLRPAGIRVFATDLPSVEEFYANTLGPGEPDSNDEFRVCGSPGLGSFSTLVEYP